MKKKKKSNEKKKKKDKKTKKLKAKKAKKILRSIYRTITDSLEKTLEHDKPKNDCEDSADTATKDSENSPDKGVSLTASPTNNPLPRKRIPRHTKSADEIAVVSKPRRSRRPERPGRPRRHGRPVSSSSDKEKKRSQSVDGSRPQPRMGGRRRRGIIQQRSFTRRTATETVEVSDNVNLSGVTSLVPCNGPSASIRTIDYDLDRPRERRPKTPVATSTIGGPVATDLSDTPAATDGKDAGTRTKTKKTDKHKKSMPKFLPVKGSVYIVKGIGHTVKVGAVGIGKGAKAGALGIGKGAKVGAVGIGKGAKAGALGIGKGAKVGAVGIGKGAFAVVKNDVVKENMKKVKKSLSSHKKEEPKGFYDKICAAELANNLLPVLGTKSDLEDDEFWELFDDGKKSSPDHAADPDLAGIGESWAVFDD